MSGSRLGRGRGGRLAIYAGCGAIVMLLIFVYRAAISEMAKLRELHEQCAHHQESLAAQLQVIFEYKVRLEKSLADEKSANLAVKQELQQRAAHAKSLRDKDTIESMQRYNSLQQDYKTLQTEHQDLQEECNNRQKQALLDSTRLESTLQELRSQLKQAKEDKVHSLEHLKTEYLAIENEKIAVDERNKALIEAKEKAEMNTQRLEKEVFQLTRELEEAKKSCGAPSRNVFNGPSVSSEKIVGGSDVMEVRSGLAGSPQNAMNLARPPAHQQSTSTSIPRVQTTRGGEVLTKATSAKAATQQVEKNSQGLRTKVKIPLGVVPIPDFIEKEIEPAENGASNLKIEGPRNEPADPPLPDKDQGPQLVPVPENKAPDSPRAQAGARHGEGAPGRQDGWLWQRNVPPGVQEVGDELNNLEKIPGLEDTGIHQVGVDYGPYEGGDYEKDPPLKNNDLHIEEGEEEGEDEDDPIDYEGHNMKPEKRPE